MSDTPACTPANEKLREFLISGAEGGLLPWRVYQEATIKYNKTYAEVEGVALEAGLLPARYQRNRNTVSQEDQLKLFRSRAAIVGCGGLGGYIIEQLARLGVGQITAIDPDVFEEHNLNRQLLSLPKALGMSKVDVVVRRIAQVNPAVTISPINAKLSAANGSGLLKGADVVVDGLDSIPGRLELATVCSELGVPMVHGTIAGWYGQVTTQFPGEDMMQRLYGRCADEKGVEKALGNPSFTPAVVASFEVAEVCKLLLGKGTSLRGRLLHINLLDMQVEEIAF